MMFKKPELIILLVTVFINSCQSQDILPVDDEQFKTVQAKEIVNKNNSFAFKFFKELANMENADNYMVSPVSLSLALGLTYNGALGDTKLAFDHVLGYETPQIEVNQFNKNLIGKLSSHADGSTMEIANSIWIDNNLKVKYDFVKLNQDYYNSKVQNLDFRDQASVGIINQWVSINTHDKIPNVIDRIKNNEVMFLINAIYFNAQWKYKFNIQNTYEESFFINESESIETDMMHMTENIAHYQNQIFSSVVLPYKQDKFSMVILLPNENKTTSDILAELNDENWNLWSNQYSVKKTQLSIPRFKLAYKNQLNDELVQMGLGIAFSDRANFGGISDVRLQITQVLQKTFIDVNEKGTEAAAATSIGVGVTSIGPELNLFYADKPFLYIIKENGSGSICFIGRLGKPND